MSSRRGEPHLPIGDVKSRILKRIAEEVAARSAADEPGALIRGAIGYLKGYSKHYEKGYDKYGKAAS